jgi:hypothetical protein
MPIAYSLKPTTKYFLLGLSIKSQKKEEERCIWSGVQFIFWLIFDDELKSRDESLGFFVIVGLWIRNKERVWELSAQEGASKLFYQT